MKKEDISKEQFDKILECFLESMMKNGLKGTTMDSLASSLQMSKRTIYEIFGTKEDLFREVHKHFNDKMAKKMRSIFLSSSNVMEGIIKCFIYNRDLMSDLSAEFIRDMQTYANNRSFITDIQRRQHYDNLYEVLQRGVEEGFFREDLNLLVLCRVFILQMEALKRTEELFPSDISLIEIYDNIIVGFLRGISTLNGMEELEKYLPTFKTIATEK